MTQEELRLAADRDRHAHWRRWGCYLSEREWGNVREDYSPDGSAWSYFPHDQARSRAYRWGEDGIAGISDNHQRLCFAIALWNGEDAILKERMYGLAGGEGNHGEDVKEYYFYLDNTPTHSYMKYLYKYPQQAFPYAQLLEENQHRGYAKPEFELLETGIFQDDGYFDVLVEYAKASPDDILIRISVTNRADQAKPLRLLPTLWFRNTWSWCANAEKPELSQLPFQTGVSLIEARHATLGTRWLYCENTADLLFTENETNTKRLFDLENASAYVKDGINDYVVQGQTDAINPDRIGTKAAAHYYLTIAPQETQVVQLRLSDHSPDRPDVALFGDAFNTIFETRLREADEFYARITSPCKLSPAESNIQRQAFAGMLWTKQFYYFVVEDWLKGDAVGVTPAAERRSGRNHNWLHVFNDDILSMPDKWEFPWFAVWDMAFHTIPLAMIDPEFAKRQLSRLTREWYMHPNGQLPAYEWAFDDGNPPLHAWATWRVYKIEQKLYGRTDRAFLERVFQKLLLNFTWWVNQVDATGMNVFQGGFLGMDNIGVFDRNVELPTGGQLNQSDGTSWMGMYSLNLLRIALELAETNPAYEDIASKFFEHFLRIAAAMNGVGREKLSLWDEEDGFYYDVLEMPNGDQVLLKVRSMVGLVPLFAVETLELEILQTLVGFRQRTEWFLQNRPDLTTGIACMQAKGKYERRLLAIMNPDQLRRTLHRMLDENEFLSPHGIRSVSKYHLDHPYTFDVNGQPYEVKYEPAESTTGLFGGNSNWRGPVWMQMNFLIIESLQKFHHYLGDDFLVECPTGSGQFLTLWQVAAELSRRLIGIFTPDHEGHRPVFGNQAKFHDPHWRDYLLFHEYYNGDNGAGLGASHQTGWAGVIAKLIQQDGEYGAQNRSPDRPKESRHE